MPFHVGIHVMGTLCGSFESSRLSQNQDREELYCVMRVECIYSTLLYSAYSVPTRSIGLISGWNLGRKRAVCPFDSKKVMTFGFSFLKSS